MSGSINLGVPDITVVIRENTDANQVLLDVPNITVNIENTPDYKVNIQPSSLVKQRTGSLPSLAVSAYSASYALKAQTLVASGTLEFADLSASNNIYVGNNLTVGNSATIPSITGSITNAISASYAQTASYALNAQSGGSGAGFPFSGSAVITGSLQVVPTGSVGGITSSLYGTASFAENVDVIFAGNYELGNDPPVALQVGGTGNIISASYALTASYANNAVLPPGVLSSSTQVIYTQIPNIPLGMISTSAQFNNLSNTSASYALTASYVTNLPTIDTGSFAVTASNVFTDSQVISGSLTTTGNANVDSLIATYNVSAPGYVDTPLLYHGGPIEIRSYYQPLQVNSNGAGILLNDTVGITGSINLTNNNVVGDTVTSTVNGTPIQINYGITKGDYTNRFSGIKVRNYDWSGGNLAGEISFWTDSEAQDFSTRRFYIDGFGKSIFESNVEVTGSFTVSGSSTLTNIGPAIFSGSLNVTNGITGSLQGTSSWADNVKFNNLSGLPTGLISSSTQIATALPAGTISSSTQIVDGIAGQTIAPANVNATGTVSGSSIQASGNSSIGGNLTVTGTITATSQSIQYVTSSQFDVSTNKILVNTDNSLRFGGISVVDSGSVNHTGSLYWDSLNDRWVYERTDGSPYNSAIVVAGPENFGTLGNERGLIIGRVPTATGDDHIDTAPQSGSIRISFANGRTDIEHGLYVTGSLDATGTVRLAGIPSSSGQIQSLLPNGIISSSNQLPSGTVSSSTQINTGSFSGSFTGSLNGTITSASYATTASYALNSTALPAGTVSSSTQVVAALPSGTISSSLQFNNLTSPFTGSFTGSHTGTFPYSGLTGIPSGIVSSSAQYPGWMTSSTQVVWSSVNYNTGIISSSTQLPAGTVSSSAQYHGWVTSSAQVNTGSFSGSFTGSLTGTITSASYAVTASYAQSATAITPAGTVSSSAQYPGWVTSSTQIVNALPAGVVSSSTQVTGYNIFATTGSNTFNGNQTITGSLTVTATASFNGTATANDVSLLLTNSSSLLLTSGSSIYVAAPGYITASLTGSLTGSLFGTASWASDVISSSYALTASYAPMSALPDGVVSSSAQYPGWVTSSTQIVWSSVNYNAGIVSSSAQVQPLLPGGTVSSSAQVKSNLPGGTISSSLQFNTLSTPFTGSYTGSFTGLINSASYVTPAGLPGGLVSSSTQIASFGNIRLQVATNRSNASAFYFNSNTRTSADSASPTADTAFLIQSTGLTTITVYLRQDNAGPNATVVGFAKNANGTAFSTAALVTSSSLNLTADTIQTYTFNGLTLGQFDAIHIYCDPTSTPGTLYGVVIVS